MIHRSNCEFCPFLATVPGQWTVIDIRTQVKIFRDQRRRDVGPRWRRRSFPAAPLQATGWLGATLVAQGFGQLLREGGGFVGKSHVDHLLHKHICHTACSSMLFQPEIPGRNGKKVGNFGKSNLTRPEPPAPHQVSLLLLFCVFWMSFFLRFLVILWHLWTTP